MAGFKERIISEQLSSLSPWAQVGSKEMAFLYLIQAQLCCAGFCLNFNNIHEHLGISLERKQFFWYKLQILLYYFGEGSTVLNRMLLNS